MTRTHFCIHARTKPYVSGPLWLNTYTCSQAHAKHMHKSHMRMDVCVPGLAALPYLSLDVPFWDTTPVRVCGCACVCVCVCVCACAHSMPGMDISGVVLRHGCLLISMDLYDRPTRAGNRPRVTPLSPTRLLGRVAGAVEAGGEPLTDGSVAYCQVSIGDTRHLVRFGN